MARIILADDDEIVAQLVTDALMGAGHAVGWLKDGSSALDIIRRRPPHLVILDCGMPEMGGIEVLQQMRRSSELHAIPVLMLTGRQSATDEAIARFEGASDYIRKPFDAAQLIGRSEALLRGERRWN